MDDQIVVYTPPYAGRYLGKRKAPDTVEGDFDDEPAYHRARPPPVRTQAVPVETQPTHGIYPHVGYARIKKTKKSNMGKRRRYTRRAAPAVPLYDPLLYRQMLIDQADPKMARGSQGSRDRYGLTYSLASAEQKANRLKYGFKGRGDYASWKPWLQKWVPKGSLSAAGGYLGGMFGPTAGAFGSAAGRLASSYLGWGRYHRKNYRGRGDYGGDAGGNQIMAGSTSTPMTVNATDDLSGDVYISHREFVGNVQALGSGASSQSAFNVVQYPINAGLTQTFPWLSQLAENFTLYELVGCIFEYKPTSGEFGSSANQLGKVIMATNYDPDATAFSNSVTMENYDYSNACKPSEHMAHGIETDNRQKVTNMLYVRTGQSTRDKIFTDYGLFQIATEGIPNSVTAGTYFNIGELWVTYRVKLSRALLNSSIGTNILADYFYGGGGASSFFDNTTALVNASPTISSAYNVPSSTSNMAAKKTNNIGCTVSSVDNKTIQITFPANIFQGNYRVTWVVNQGTGTANTVASPVFNSYCVVEQALYAGGVPNAAQVYYAPGVAATAANKFQSVILKVSAPGNNIATLQLGYTASILSAGSTFSVWVEQVNPTLSVLI